MLESNAVTELVNVINAIKGGSLEKYAVECPAVIELVDGWIIRFVDASEIWFDASSFSVYGPPDFEKLMEVSECVRKRYANRLSLEIALNGLQQATPLLDAKIAAESVQSDK